MYNLGMGSTLAIDPGAEQGWAVFNGRTLSACGPDFPPGSLLTELEFVIVEKPTSYRGSPVPPNDLITLGTRAGRALGKAEGLTGIQGEYVEPRTWKGNRTKAEHHPKVWSFLGAAEQAILGAALMHHAPKTLVRYADLATYLATAPESAKGRDIIDAVALGMWKVGRRT